MKKILIQLGLAAITGLLLNISFHVIKFIYKNAPELKSALLLGIAVVTAITFVISFEWFLKKYIRLLKKYWFGDKQ